jgi:hypothetical protein
MFGLINSTMFKTGSAALFDMEGHDLAVVAVKATFELSGKDKKADLAPVLCKDPVEVFPMDQYAGEPGMSGIQYPADLVPGKRGTDIGVLGTVYSPGGNAATKLKASVKVGGLYKELLVTGNRIWTKSLFKPGYTVTEPEPFRRMPLCWERTFGGVATTRKKEKIPYEDNPAGTGYVLEGDRVGGTRLPNFEDPKQRIKTYRKTYIPATFGFSLPSSARRRLHAGTYDGVWMKKRRPLYPEDMDIRFFNCAQAELTSDGFLKGGETVTLSNLTPGGHLRFVLPVCDIAVTFCVSGKLTEKKADLHTVTIEPDLDRFSMTWSASERPGKSLHRVEWIEAAIRNETAAALFGSRKD